MSECMPSHHQWTRFLQFVVFWYLPVLHFVPFLFFLMWLRISQISTQQEKSDLGAKRDIDGMGVPEIKYGDTVCFIMHVATGLWLSYLAPDAKSSRLGPLKRRVSFLCCALAHSARLSNKQRLAVSRLSVSDHADNFISESGLEVFHFQIMLQKMSSYECIHGKKKYLESWGYIFGN